MKVALTRGFPLAQPTSALSQPMEGMNAIGSEERSTQFDAIAAAQADGIAGGQAACSSMAVLRTRPSLGTVPLTAIWGVTPRARNAPMNGLAS